MVGIIRAILNEIQVNSSSFRTGDQRNPVSASFENGNSLFIYENPFAVNDQDIQANFFNSSFVRSSVEIGTPGLGFSAQNDVTPSITILSNVTDQTQNRALVVWDNGTTGAGTGHNIVSRLVDQNGNTLNAQTSVFSGTGDQVTPDVAALQGARSVVVWQDQNGGNRIIAQIIQADGATLSGGPIVVQAAGNNPSRPKVVGLSSGGFVVTWQDTGTVGDTSGTGIRAQIFNASGVAIGNVLRVNTNSTGDQSLPEITALSNGGFAIAWQDASARPDAAGLIDNDGTGIKVRVYQADGTAVTDEILANTATTGNQSSPSIASAGSAGFIVAWTDPSQTAASNGIDTSGTAIKSQAFSLTGARIGTEFLVNQLTANNQDHVSLSTRTDGTVIATLEDASNQVQGAQSPDTSGVGIQAQVLKVDNAPVHSYLPAYRFYDTVTTDHFYTTSLAESNSLRATLPTFNFEGSAWSTPDAGSDTTPVYRFFDTVTRTHFLTTDLGERDSIIANLRTYNYEGATFQAYKNSQDSGQLVLERFYNTLTGVHTYSASIAETNSIRTGGAGMGWVDEGSSFIVHQPL